MPTSRLRASQGYSIFYGHARAQALAEAMIIRKFTTVANPVRISGAGQRYSGPSVQGLWRIVGNPSMIPVYPAFPLPDTR